MHHNIKIDKHYGPLTHRQTKGYLSEPGQVSECNDIAEELKFNINFKGACCCTDNFSVTALLGIWVNTSSLDMEM